MGGGNSTCKCDAMEAGANEKGNRPRGLDHSSPRRGGFDPQVREIPWRRKWLSTPVFLPGEFHRQRRLVGYSLLDPKGQTCASRPFG